MNDDDENDDDDDDDDEDTRRKTRTRTRTNERRTKREEQTLFFCTCNGLHAKCDLSLLRQTTPIWRWLIWDTHAVITPRQSSLPYSSTLNPLCPHLSFDFHTRAFFRLICVHLYASKWLFSTFRKLLMVENGFKQMLAITIFARISLEMSRIIQR